MIRDSGSVHQDRKEPGHSHRRCTRSEDTTEKLLRVRHAACGITISSVRSDYQVVDEEVLLSGTRMVKCVPSTESIMTSNHQSLPESQSANVSC